MFIYYCLIHELIALIILLIFIWPNVSFIKNHKTFHFLFLSYTQIVVFFFLVWIIELIWKDGFIVPDQGCTVDGNHSITKCIIQITIAVINVFIKS